MKKKRDRTQKAIQKTWEDAWAAIAKEKRKKRKRI